MGHTCGLFAQHVDAIHVESTCMHHMIIICSASFMGVMSQTVPQTVCAAPLQPERHGQCCLWTAAV